MKKIIISITSLILCISNPTVVFGQTVPSVVFNVTTNGLISPVTPTVTWSSDKASRCFATSSPVDNKWNGEVALNGTTAVGPITKSTIYSISCSSANDTTATLTWTAPTLNTDETELTDLAGFKVYEIIDGKQVLTSDVGRVYNTLPVINLSSGNHTFYVTAYNTSGIESSPSNAASKTIYASAFETKSSTVNVTKKTAPPRNLTVR